MYNRQIEEAIEAASLSEFDADPDAELFELSTEEIEQFADDCFNSNHRLRSEPRPAPDAPADHRSEAVHPPAGARLRPAGPI
jgi:hypothetical protein